ncbi:MAG: DNA repair protein RadC [Hydrogenothermaceae bacterium]|nr:DNA repair protein RadC [Hydrogenothermaceae bacterium]
MKQERGLYRKSVKELPVELLPREKALKYGIESLSDEELLALSLGSGTKGLNVIGLSAKVLAGSKGIKYLKDVKLDQLERIKGIGKAKALQIMAIGEMIRRSGEDGEKEKISSVLDAVKYLKYLSKERQETLVALYLNSSNEIVHRQTVAVGSLNVVRVLPRDVLFYALKYNSNGIILSHNHPEGSAKPSSEDIEFTKRLMHLSNEMGFELLDHIIIGKKDYYSFAGNSLI